MIDWKALLLGPGKWLIAIAVLVVAAVIQSIVLASLGILLFTVASIIELEQS